MNMNTYKGFDSNMKCRGFQYEAGKTYEHDGDIAICQEGFHAISEESSPLEVFCYYPPVGNDGKPSRYCEVETGGETVSDGKKVCCKKLTIGAEIGIPGIIRAHVEWVKKNLIDDDEHKSSSTGNQSAATSTGDQSAATNTGDQSAATSTGNQSAATNTGDQSAATSTGNQSSAEVSGKGSVAAVFGRHGIVRGSVGCAIFGVELLCGRIDLLTPEGYISKKRESLLRAKKGQLKRLNNEPDELDLFDIAINKKRDKIERIENEIRKLENGEIIFWVPESYKNLMHKYLKKQL